MHSFSPNLWANETVFRIFLFYFRLQILFSSDSKFDAFRGSEMGKVSVGMYYA